MHTVAIAPAVMPAKAWSRAGVGKKEGGIESLPFGAEGPGELFDPSAIDGTRKLFVVGGDRAVYGYDGEPLGPAEAVLAEDVSALSCLRVGMIPD